MVPEQVIGALAGIGGVKALALGGSKGRDEADEHSDFDIGLYYGDEGLDAPALQRALEALDDNHGTAVLNPPGEWGPWINGGAWITVDGQPVDILLREADRVRRVLDDCLAGHVTIDYQCGHPFGFTNTIYAAETHYCKPLWQDDSRVLDGLKAHLYSQGPYPPLMGKALENRFLWEAWFSLACGCKAAMKGDLNYAMGSVFRTVCSWLEVVYALNGAYLMNEKGAFKRVATFEAKPRDMRERVENAYRLFVTGEGAEAYRILDDLHEEIKALTDGIA